MYRTIFFVLVVCLAVCALAAGPVAPQRPAGPVAPQRPTGPRRNLDRTRVTIVENGTHFVRNGDNLIVKQPSGKMSVNEIHRNESLSQKRLPINGWYTSLWTNGPYDLFTAYWEVPPYPATDNGQILFYFNSLENNPVNDILQPVLQLNNGISGWTVAAWYGVGDDYYEANPTAVSPGDYIYGVIILAGGTWYIEANVNGQLANYLTVSTSEVGGQYFAQWANENYNVEDCTYLPPTGGILAGSIYLGYNGNEQYPSWYPEIYDNSCTPSAYGSTYSAALTWLNISP